MNDLPPTLHADLLAVGGAWLGYVALHSALAMTRTKRALCRRWAGAARGYRLGYNGLAVVLLIPPIWLTYAAHGDPLWAWRGMWGWFADGVALAALIGFFLTLSHYSTAHFVGTAQWRAAAVDAVGEAPLAFSPLHRFVRHPWYFLALLLIWSRDMDAAHLVAAVILSLYLALGSRIEERRLIAAYGERYRRYQRRVPALTPLPWRYLSTSALRELAAYSESNERPVEHLQSRLPEEKPKCP